MKQSIFVLSQGYRLLAVLFVSMLLAPPVLAQDEAPNTAPAAPSEYLTEAVEGENEVGGTDAQQVDSQEVQADEALAGEDVPGVTRFKQQQIEEIVVQARKRAELLEDTPVSVTALGENTLREAGITRLDQIQELVPNLQFQSGLGGQDVQIYIRGVGTDRADLAFDPGVGVYVDGVFLPRAQGNFLDVLDVEQIEVLRGPQGTLFGKNTIGGAINITTVKPGPELEGFAMVKAGNYNSVVARASINIPIDIGWFEDKLFSRFTVGSNNRKGYVYNALRDEHWSDANSITFLGSLRFLPWDDITIDLSGTYSSEHTRAAGGYCVVANEGAALGSPQLFNACNESKDPYVTYADTNQMQAIESFGTWVTAAWDAPDFGFLEDNQLKILTSWRKQRPRRRSDVDNTRVPVINLQSLGAAGNPQAMPSFAMNGAPGLAQQISTEVQWSGGITDKFNYIAGYFVFLEQATERLSTQVQAQLGPNGPPYPYDQGVNPSPPYCSLPGASCLPGRATRKNTNIDNWTWAMFAQGTWDPTDWLAITGGIRYTEDKKGLSYKEWSWGALAPYDINANTPIPDTGNNPQGLSKRKLFKSWTPMATIAATMPEEYFDDTPLDHLMGYFTYSQGFKGGGFGVLTGGAQAADDVRAFKPEYLDNFEIGLKTVAFDQLLTANISIFVGLYQDIQVVSNKAEGVDTEEVSIVTIVNNAASATTRGIEFELVARPIEGLILMSNLGFLDAVYNNFQDTESGFDASNINRSGQRFKGVPRFNSFLAAQYSMPLDVNGPQWLQGWVTPRIEWAYTSAINFVGPEVPQARQSGWNAINARLSYSFMNDDAEVGLWAKNLLNIGTAQWMSPIVNSFGVLGKYYTIKRTFGAELSYRF
ncbi:MAG: TonB-dependent receptor [Candidatus Binatia bacterium]|nr:TonB-dependent receptor [Candidatus Binatia bacterium]MDG1959320.1 TonB-dependent receptor [Candidatus Binatia bacterium]MDG2009735.1 TonB-dependent receptor [Candidatus Binatia bacterium]